MKRSWVFLGMFLSGCTTGPALNFKDGAYYMSGDPDCAKARTVSPGVIECYTSKMGSTGYRRALTPQEVLAYQQIQANNQAATAAYRPPPMQPIQYPTMAAPQVTPITPPGGNQVRCIGVGIYTNCRY